MKCIHQQNVTTIDAGGNLGVLTRCAHTQCCHFTRIVSDECSECIVRVPPELKPVFTPLPAIAERDFKQPILRADGCIVYERTGLEPPIHPEGYEPTSDPWIFRPVWPPCPFRSTMNGIRPCGCVKINPHCTAPEKKGLVTLEICKECTIRPGSSPPDQTPEPGQPSE